MPPLDRREELRRTLDATGWGETDAALVVDTTAARICGPSATDAELEAEKARLWVVWRLHFDVVGAG